MIIMLVENGDLSEETIPEGLQDQGSRKNIMKETTIITSSKKNCRKLFVRGRGRGKGVSRYKKCTNKNIVTLTVLHRAVDL